MKMTSSKRRAFAIILKRSEEAVVWVIGASVFLFIALILVTLPSYLIRWSARQLPEWLHGVVLAVTAGLVVWGIYLISTEDLRERSLPLISRLFGALAGPVILIGVLLLTTAQGFASFTFMLFDADLVELTAEIADRPIDEVVLVDFYLWHFLDMIPALSIPELLNLPPPIGYSGTWVGVLVLLFDAMIVLILIPTFRFWLRIRREKRRQDADWEQAISSAARNLVPDEDPASVVRRWSDPPGQIRRSAQDSPKAVVALTYRLVEGMVRSSLEAIGHRREQVALTVAAQQARSRGVVGAETLKAIDQMNHLWDLTRLPHASLSAKQALQFASLAQAVAGTLGVGSEEFVSIVEDSLP